MNIHPIFVHFPIALLTVYAIAELARFKKLIAEAYYFYVKATLVIAGTLGAFSALLTGDPAEHALTDKSLRPLVETHSTFAAASTWIFTFLALVYIVLWINRSSWNEKLLAGKFSKIWIVKVKVADWILHSPFVPILALIGLVTITITGALGGAIVYGPNVDPIVSWIYHLFY